MRLRYGRKHRTRILIPTVDEVLAARRAEELQALANTLTGQPPDVVVTLLKRAAAADTRGLLVVRKAAWAAAAAGVEKSEARPWETWTVRELGEAWTSGELAKQWPDTVGRREHSRIDASRLAAHVYPVVGDVLVKAFRLANYEAVMRSLEGKRKSQKQLSPLSRRTIALTLTRLLAIAVYPLKILVAHPVPKGAVPRAKRSRAASYLYPDEDAALMACEAVEFPWRCLWGFLVREGCRVSEALSLRWEDLDLVRGVVRLDKNKTDDPRAWALSAGVAVALTRLHEQAEGNLVFPQPPDPLSLARQLRSDLQASGITRSELFTNTAQRMMLRVHDLRGSFVTVALANGRSEAWVCDRTGHKSSQMIATYKRAARSAAELQLGDWRPLASALRLG